MGVFGLFFKIKKITKEDHERNNKKKDITLEIIYIINITYTIPQSCCMLSVVCCIFVLFPFLISVVLVQHNLIIVNIPQCFLVRFLILSNHPSLEVLNQIWRNKNIRIYHKI